MACVNSRCAKVLPLAVSVYQDGLPLHYVGAVHLAKVSRCHSLPLHYVGAVHLAKVSRCHSLPLHYVRAVHLAKVSRCHSLLVTPRVWFLFLAYVSLLSDYVISLLFQCFHTLVGQ